MTLNERKCFFVSVLFPVTFSWCELVSLESSHLYTYTLQKPNTATENPTILDGMYQEGRGFSMAMLVLPEGQQQSFKNQFKARFFWGGFKIRTMSQEVRIKG